MAGMITTQGRPLRVLRKKYLAAAIPTGTTTLLESVPVKGYGTMRVHASQNDQQVAINVLQKPQKTSTTTFTFGNTMTLTVAATPTTGQNPVNVLADYAQFTITTTTAPTSIEIEITLFP